MNEKSILLLVALLTLFFISCKDDPEPLEISFIINPVSVYGTEDGSIDITIEQGNPPYSFEWSNGATTEDVENLAAGSYIVSIKDSENQNLTETFTVEKVEPLFSDVGSVTDYDGNVYKTVKIGNQWWMAEDLKVQHNPQGVPIVSYPVHGNISLGNSIGRLYTYNVAMNNSTVEGSQGIAPNGWHIPTDEDWEELYDFLGGIEVAGEKMKSAGTVIWRSPNIATNESGFSAMPGGACFDNGNGYEGYPFAVHYWSSTKIGNEYRKHSIMNDGADAYVIQSIYDVGISIRGIKD